MLKHKSLSQLSVLLLLPCATTTVGCGSLQLLAGLSQSSPSPGGSGAGLTSGSSNKLVITGPSTVTGGICSSAFTVTATDANGNALQVTSNTSLTMAGNGSGAFYLDSGCTNAVNTTTNPVTIANATSAANFYFKDAITENVSLNASYSTWSAGTLAINSRVITRVQTAAADTTSGGNTSLTLTPAATSAGSVILVAIGVAATTVSSVTDNRGQSYTLIRSQVSSSAGSSLYVYYKANTQAGVNSITVTFPFGNASAIMAEYSGLSTLPLDQSSIFDNPFGGSNPWTSNNTGATTSSYELVLGVALDPYTQSQAFGAGTGWTSVTSHTYPSGSTLFLQEKILNAVFSNYAATGTAPTNTAGSEVVAFIGAFK